MDEIMYYVRFCPKTISVCLLWNATLGMSAARSAVPYTATYGHGPYHTPPVAHILSYPPVRYSIDHGRYTA